MDRLYMFIATGVGTGYLPIAPGTWGSLLAIPLFLLLAGLSPLHYAITLGILFPVAVICAGQAEKILDRKDPGVVVIDEILGMLITLIAVPNGALPLLLGFLLFRFFDITKPWPIRLIDRRMNGGLGIVLDDVLAGVYSLAALQGIWYLFTSIQH